MWLGGKQLAGRCSDSSRGGVALGSAASGDRPQAGAGHGLVGVGGCRLPSKTFSPCSLLPTGSLKT